MDKRGIGEKQMSKEEIFNILKDAIEYIVPEIETDNLTSEDSLKELGANSVDRAEIIIMVMEDTHVKLPLVSFGMSKNIGEIVDVIYNAL